MVRVYGAVFGDVTDRATRKLGRVGGPDQGAVIDRPRPWWVPIASGRICYLDDFEDTLRWAQSTATISKASDPKFVHSGASALKGVTAATAGISAAAEIFLAPLAESSTYAALGFWACLNAAADDTPRDLYVTWLVDDRANNAGHIFGLRFVNYIGTVQRKLQYWNSAGAWADVTDGTARMRITAPEFRYFGITIKRTAGTAWKYEQLKMDGRTFSLTAVAGEPMTFAIPDQDIVLGCTTDAAAATTMYVDDFSIVDMLEEIE